jgi:hypothetical protein
MPRNYDADNIRDQVLNSHARKVSTGIEDKDISQWTTKTYVIYSHVFPSMSTINVTTDIKNTTH